MVNVLDAHHLDIAVGRLLMKKTAHNLTDAQQWRFGHPNWTIADVGSGEKLRVDINRGFLIGPGPVQGFSLKRLSLSRVRLEIISDTPPDTWAILIMPIKSAMPRAVTVSRMQSLGMVPLPTAPERPSRRRCTVSLATSPDTLHAHPTVG